MSDEFDTLDPYVRWIASEARRSIEPDPAARGRLLAAIRAEPAPKRRTRYAWLIERRSIVLPPIAAAALAAGLVGIGVMTGLAINRDGRPSAVQASGPDAALPQLPDSLAPRAIKFVLVAPKAARVAVVGDFNGWDAAANPMKAEGDGTWTTFVPLRPGMHNYSFVVDGTHFVADPTAPIAPDDAYGIKGSVVLVGGAAS